MRYSTTNFGGTARSMGVGGAFGALGADFSAAGINPAGIGFNRKREFMVTPGMSFGKSSATFYGENTQDNINRFYLGNVGLITIRKFRRQVSW